MAIPANQIRNGMILIVNDKPHRVVSKQHVTPGKGQAGKDRTVLLGRLIHYGAAPWAPIRGLVATRRPRVRSGARQV